MMKNLNIPFKFNRITSVGVTITMVASLVLFKMAQIQMSAKGQAIRNYADQNFEYQTLRLEPERGNIYDRYGFLLAGNREVYQVGVDLNDIKNPDTLARELSSILDLDYSYVYSRVTLPFEEGKPAHAVIDDFVDPEKIDRLEQLVKEYETNPDGKKKSFDSATPSLNGVTWEPHLMRNYPENKLASNVLGFYSLNPDLGGAVFGIEQKYDSLLAGTPLDVRIPVEPRKVVDIPSIPPGASLMLTIDRKIQDSVEKTMDRYVKKNGATSGTAIVMDPRTGEILAMVTSPRIDPNKYWEFYENPPEGGHFNNAIDYPYEPGSVFKVITMGSALDAGVVKPDTPFLDQGVINVGGVDILNWDSNAWGPQTMVGCMQHSLNVCLSWVALQLTPSRFYDYIRAFGIDKFSNIDLAGERIYPMDFPGDSTWSEVEIATNSFGQGLMASPIQMITAIAAFANDGKMMTPHILKKVIDNTQETEIPARLLGTPVSAKTARTLTDMLAYSLEEEASTALVEGYRVAGKTGTAEIAGPYGYTSQQTNASFVGWGPVDDPRFIVYVWLEKPTTSIWGSIVAAPLFQQIVSDLVVLMDLPPDDVRQQLKQ